MSVVDLWTCRTLDHLAAMTRLTRLALRCTETGNMLPPAMRAIVAAPALRDLTIAILQDLKDMFVGPPIGVQTSVASLNLSNVRVSPATATAGSHEPLSLQSSQNPI